MGDAVLTLAYVLGATGAYTGTCKTLRRAEVPLTFRLHARIAIKSVVWPHYLVLSVFSPKRITGRFY